MSHLSDYEFIEYELNEKKKLSMLCMYHKIDKMPKLSLVAITIKLDNVIICKNFIQSVIFKEELSLFDNTDDTNNQYFQNTFRKVHDINTRTLLLAFKENKYYFSRIEAKAIVYTWNMIINTYSCQELPKNIDFWELYYERYPYGY